jgi:hypothetical protein
VIKWDWYQLTSESNRLDPAGWFSFGDWVVTDPLAVISKYGVGALGMGEVPNISEGLLAELHGTGSVDLPPGDRVYLGKPVKDPFAPGFDVSCEYTYAGALEPKSCYLPSPEPSTWVLAVAGVACLLVLARRRPASRPRPAAGS